MLNPVKAYIVLGVAALALACAAVTGYRYAGVKAENEALVVANAALTEDLAAARLLREMDQETAKRHAKRVATLTTENRKTNEKLYWALEQNAAWAGQRVPDDVDTALGL